SDRPQKKTFLSTSTAHRSHMKRVTGIGGIFFKAKDAPSLQAWYKRHLGIDVQAWGGAAFDWTDSEGKPVAGTTAWLISPQESRQFAPSSARFMVNYRVEDLHAFKTGLRVAGVHPSRNLAVPPWPSYRCVGVDCSDDQRSRVLATVVSLEGLDPSHRRPGAFPSERAHDSSIAARAACGLTSA